MKINLGGIRKKNIQVALFVALIVVIAASWFAYQYPSIAELQKCIETKNELHGYEDYVKGQASIGFKETISNQEIMSILESHDLGHSDILTLSDTKFVTIYVPEGEEFEWMCKLESNPNVVSSSMNIVMHGS